MADCPEGVEYARTRQGCIRGAAAGSVQVFKGIPYAAPPIGALRWRPPAAPELRDGVTDALAFGRACPQNTNSFGGETPQQSEDCLTLNVWTPSTIREPSDEALPVMVWIHGGGLYEGAGSFWNYDGQYLAELGSVVVLSINYRLGALGFMAHPALSDEDESGVSGNYGTLDQIAALQWVRDNIGFFGGDPDNVTVFGESGGGIAICALMVAPPARGLFHRAMMDSAKCQGYGPLARHLTMARPPGAPESAEAQGARFATAVGCTTGDVLECMRSKTPAQLLAAQPGNALNGGELFGFAVDGELFDDSPRAMVLDGDAADIPFIGGTTTDEATVFTLGIQVNTTEQYEAYVETTFGDYADEILEVYPASGFATPHAALDALTGDLSFICPNRQVLRELVQKNSNTYQYLFGQVPPLGAALGWGSYHGAQVEFLHGSLRLRPDEIPDANGEEIALSNAMVAYWSNFARTGDPNGEGTSVTWPRFNREDGPYMYFATPIQAREDLKPTQCDALEAIIF